MSDHLVGEGVYRKLHASETDKLKEHLLRLDPDSRRLRFGHPVPDAIIKKYAEHAPSSGSVVHGFFTGEDLRGAAELRPISALLPTKAEAAFSVEKAFQGHGIGTELFRRLILSARNRGIHSLTMMWLPENSRMRALALQEETAIEWLDGEVVGTVEAPHATALSFMREVFEDISSFGSVVWDDQKRMMKLG